MMFNERIRKKFNRINPRYYPVVAFTLTAFVYTLALSGLGMVGKSLYIIETGDLYAQFIPFIMQMCEVIRGKHSIWYSWNIALGSGSIGNYAYFTFSPFNIFYLILGVEHVHIASAIVLILKASFSAFTFQKFLAKVLKKIYYESILFSMLYALNGFVICYYHVTIFMDAVMIFPVIILGIITLLHEKKCGVLIFAYSYLISTQLYMGYVAGVSSFIVFFVYYLVYVREINDRIAVLLRYSWCVIASLGITACIWIPALLNILEMDTSDAMYNNIFRPDIFMIINNMFLGHYQSMDGFIPFYYCGILAAFLAPAFFLNRKIDIKKRLFYGVTIGLFVIIMCVPGLNIAMHGFDEPNMIGYRYSFVLSFMIVSVLAYQFPYIRNNICKIKYTVCFCVLYTIVFVISKYTIICKWGKEYDDNYWWIYIINICFILAWEYVIRLYDTKKFDTVTLRTIITAIIVTELVTNIFIIQPRIDKLVELVDNYMITARNNTVRKIKENPDHNICIRTIYNDEYMSDYALRSDLSSLAFFSPIMNNRLIKCMIDWGYGYMWNRITGNGWTPVTASILSIDYVINSKEIISEDPSEQVVIEANNRYFQKYAVNSKVLPIAFYVNDDILEYRAGKSVFDNQNRLLSLMCGESVECYIPTEMQINTDGAGCKRYEDNVRIYNSNYPGKQGVIYFSSVENKQLPMYANLYNEKEILADDTNYIHPTALYSSPLRGLYNSYCVSLYPNQLFEVSVDENGNGSFSMIIPPEIEYTEYERGYYVYYDEKEYSKVFDKLKKHGLIINEFNDGYVSGNIECEDDCILFSSIPYEKGWNAYVDGVKTEVIPIVEETFVGLKLSEGKHSIILEYVAPGMYVGRCVSIVTIVLMVFKAYVSKKLTKKANEE